MDRNSRAKKIFTYTKHLWKGALPYVLAISVVNGSVTAFLIRSMIR